MFYFTRKAFFLVVALFRKRSVPKKYIKKPISEVLGFTLIELLIAITIVSILVSFAVPQYLKTVERAKDSEAKANLMLIQAAEKIYKLEANQFYASPHILSINADLRLDLNNIVWSYRIDTYPGGLFTAKAIRSDWKARTYWINETKFQPSCTGVAGACP